MADYRATLASIDTTIRYLRGKSGEDVSQALADLDALKYRFEAEELNEKVATAFNQGRQAEGFVRLPPWDNLSDDYRKFFIAFYKVARMGAR